MLLNALIEVDRLYDVWHAERGARLTLVTWIDDEALQWEQYDTPLRRVGDEVARTICSARRIDIYPDLHLVIVNAPDGAPLDLSDICLQIANEKAKAAGRFVPMNSQRTPMANDSFGEYSGVSSSAPETPAGIPPAPLP